MTKKDRKNVAVSSNPEEKKSEFPAGMSEQQKEQARQQKCMNEIAPILKKHGYQFQPNMQIDPVIIGLMPDIASRIHVGFGLVKVPMISQSPKG